MNQQMYIANEKYMVFIKFNSLAASILLLRVIEPRMYRTRRTIFSARNEINGRKKQYQPSIEIKSKARQRERKK